jgi:ERCC4-related helicase
LTLDESCDLIQNNYVDVILSTSAGYRALDFPGLTSILLIQGNIAGVVLQCVGRVARGTKSNIISLVPENSNIRIPIYSKGLDMRVDMVKDYYKNCPQEDILITENDLLTNTLI